MIKQQKTKILIAIDHTYRFGEWRPSNPECRVNNGLIDLWIIGIVIVSPISFLSITFGLFVGANF